MRKSAYALTRRCSNVIQANRRLFHDAAPPVRVTTLPNNIRVATDEAPGHFSSVGLYIDAGARYEKPETAGVSHFLDRLAFKSTKSRTETKMLEDIQDLGGQIMSTSTRELIMYQSSHSHKDTPLAMSVLADTALNPAFLEEEVNTQRDSARFELRESSAKPETFLPEILHAVAYNYKELGNPLLCQADRIDTINGTLLHQVRKDWYRPEKMIIAGTGMKHEHLVELTDKYFSSLKPTITQPLARPSISTLQSNIQSPSPPSLAKNLTRAASYLFPHSSASDVPAFLSSSSYTGGRKFIFDGSSEFNHLYIAFEGVGLHDDDIFALATMQILLGGGGSFSAGGPGKGMYSRLYTHILNHYAQIEHCASFHHIYNDSSLFGLFASFLPASTSRGGTTASQLLPHLIHQLSLLAYTRIPDTELKRAKNQLKSSLMMSLESRATAVEDLGRQILVYNRHIPMIEMTHKVDMLTGADIQRVAARIFGPKSGNTPTIVCSGHEDLEGACAETFKKYGISAARL